MYLGSRFFEREENGDFGTFLVYSYHIPGSLLWGSHSHSSPVILQKQCGVESAAALFRPLQKLEELQASVLSQPPSSLAVKEVKLS